MARKAKAETASKDEVTKPAKEEAPKYGVAYIAEQLGIEPASVRVKFRKLGIEKTGRSYGWDTLKAADAVVKQCKAAAPEEKAEDGDDAPKAKRGKRKAKA